MTEEDIRSSISQSGCDASGASVGAEVSAATDKLRLAASVYRLGRLVKAYADGHALSDGADVAYRNVIGSTRTLHADLAAVLDALPKDDDRLLFCGPDAGPAPSTAWRDIASAPRDGTRVLACGGGLEAAMEIVTYNTAIGCWDCADFSLDDRDGEAAGYSRPALWQPLPPPPVGES